ncbi:MAG: TonB-dependent receptor [Opitutaceae bacterium]|nr:TonB-dependent receptor [Opitutaceae bacterium]
MSLSRFFLSSLLSIGTAVHPAHADDGDANEPLHLEPLVVSASPYAREPGELAQPVSVLDGNRLARQQATSLGELLANEPGVSSTWFGPGASRPIVRGLGGDRLKVIENSVGTLDASITSPDHAVALDPLLIERVEVVRGPAALLYGGNAVGGVVNVITHRIHETLPDHPLAGRFEVRTQSVNDEQSAGIVLDGAAGSFAWHLDGFRRKTHDLQIPSYAESARLRATGEEHEHDDEEHEEAAEAYGTVPNTALTADGGAFGLSYIGEAGHVGLAWSGYNTFYGVPAGAHSHAAHEHEHDEEEHADETAHADKVSIDLVQRRIDVQGAFARDSGLLRGARFKFGSADYRHQELEGAAVGTVFRNRGHDARVELLHQPLAGFTGAFGWQGGRSNFAAIGDEAFVPPSRTTNQALFLFEELAHGTLTWQFGGRAETQRITLRDGSGRSHRDHLLSASGGVVWNAAEMWTLGLALARSERAPNAQEHFADGPHPGTGAYEIGDPNLGIETSTAIDLTLRKRAGLITGALTLFTNQFDGFVFEQPTGLLAVDQEDHFDFVDADHTAAEEGLAVYRFTQSNARFQGVEAELVVHLHNGGPDRLDLYLAADTVRGKETSTGRPLPRITPNRTKVGLEWTSHAFTLGGEVQFVAAQNRLAAQELPTDGYTLVSAHAGYRLVTGRTAWDFFLRGTNLGNTEARVHTSFLKDIIPLPGRSVHAGVRMSF